jgi:transcription elongation GreA/GreB family factor
MTASDSVRLGSLVEIEVTGRSDHYFIGPSEGGLEISVDGTEILLITPASPLGARLMGKTAGERITLPSGQPGTVKNIG